MPGICHVFNVVDEDTLVSVNPKNHDETNVMGKLVKLE
jgi:hypothetical protein